MQYGSSFDINHQRISPVSQSKSKLLNYISLLLSDDEALQRFLIDPITDAEGKYGLTKAERAVLRRTVFHLSNRSLNGYTLVRHLGSYRRSLRLLQNVLHNAGSKMGQEAHIAASGPAEDADVAIYTVLIYVPERITSSSQGTQTLTGLTNHEVQQKYGNPYGRWVPYYVLMPRDSSTTIMDVMTAAGVSFKTSTGNDGLPYVASITPIGGFPEISADPTDPRYDLDKHPDADFVFWFWSIDGTPNITKGFGGSGSFAQQVLQPDSIVFWQVIAPDTDNYGFMRCEPTNGNAFAEAAKAAKALKA
jgi:hypothetical protein